MIWRRTLLGDQEVKARTLLQGPSVRNLPMILEGKKTEELLLANLVGIKGQDFRTLFDLGLIEPASRASSPPVRADLPKERTDALASGVDIRFSAALRRLISTHLGFGGFALINSIETARSTVYLHQVAEQAIALIRARKGMPAADEARRQLFGR